MAKLEWQCKRAFSGLVAPLVDAFTQLKWQSEQLGRLKAIIIAEFPNEDLSKTSWCSTQRYGISLDSPFLTTWSCKPNVGCDNADTSTEIKSTNRTCVNSDGHLWYELY